MAAHDWLEDPVTALAPLVVPVYAVATIALWFLARPYAAARWKLASASALASAGLAMVVDQAISHAWARPRPFVAHDGLTHVLSGRSADPSFPSDHASAAFAIAFAVLAFSRRAGIGFLVVATLIGVSRIALGLHYPSDVLAGLLVGWVSALAVTRAGRPLLERPVFLLGRVSDRILAPAWGVRATRSPTRR